MKITKRQLRRIIREAQWGRFTGGAAPLDEPPMDSGRMSPEMQQRVFDLLVDSGSNPEELIATGEYPDIIVSEGKCDKASGHEGCVRKRASGWVVLSNKTGKPWRGGGEKDGDVVYYSSKEEANKALGAYHQQDNRVLK